jgi:hypothetical protein
MRSTLLIPKSESLSVQFCFLTPYCTKLLSVLFFYKNRLMRVTLRNLNFQIFSMQQGRVVGCLFGENQQWVRLKLQVFPTGSLKIKEHLDNV